MLTRIERLKFHIYSLSLRPEFENDRLAGNP